MLRVVDTRLQLLHCTAVRARILGSVSKFCGLFSFTYSPTSQRFETWPLTQCNRCYHRLLPLLCSISALAPSSWLIDFVMGYTPDFDWFYWSLTATQLWGCAFISWSLSFRRPQLLQHLNEALEVWRQLDKLLWCRPFGQLRPLSFMCLRCALYVPMLIGVKETTTGTIFRAAPALLFNIFFEVVLHGVVMYMERAGDAIGLLNKFLSMKLAHPTIYKGCGHHTNDRLEALLDGGLAVFRHHGALIGRERFLQLVWFVRALTTVFYALASANYHRRPQCRAIFALHLYSLVLLGLEVLAMRDLLIRWNANVYQFIENMQRMPSMDAHTAAAFRRERVTKHVVIRQQQITIVTLLAKTNLNLLSTYPNTYTKITFKVVLQIFAIYTMLWGYLHTAVKSKYPRADCKENVKYISK